MNIDRTKYKNTIFVVSSPQEAIGLLIISQNNEIEYCAIVDYIGYTDGNYIKIIDEIIKEIKIKNIYRISMYLHNIQINNRNILLSLIEIFKNKKIINEFNRKNFNGKLFKRNFIFVVQPLCPLLTLTRYDLNKVCMMEHAPADSKLRNMKENINNIEDNLYKNKNNNKLRLLIIAIKKINLNKIINLIKSKIIKIIIKLLSHNHNRVFYLKRCYSWIKYNDIYEFLDYNYLKNK